MQLSNYGQLELITVGCQVLLPFVDELTIEE